MKRILFLIDTLQTGGAEKSLLAITSRFTKFKPVFFQLYPGDDLLPKFNKEGIEVRQFNLEPNYNFKQIAQHIIKEIHSIDPHLIHSTLFRSDLVGRHVSTLVDVPLINGLVNNSYSKRRYKALSLAGKAKLFAIQMWDKSTASKVSLFISNSNTIKESNAQALHIPLEKIKVIYRGRDFLRFTTVNSSSVNGLRQSLGIHSSKKIFLNVSRLLDRKGQLDLLRAFNKVHKQEANAVLLIAGEGTYRSVLEDEIERLNIGMAVKILGNCNNVPVLLNLADYFIFPSHYEGLPGALIEAMFSKIPIIASSIPENLECINETNALLFPVGNVDEMATQMIHAMSNRNWEERTERAFTFAMHHFEISKIAAQYEETYEQLLIG